MIRNLLDCEGCERRRQAMKAWLDKLKGISMSTVDKRVREAVSKIVKESGVSEPAVLKVIEAIKNADAAAVAIILDSGNTPNAETKKAIQDSRDGNTERTSINSLMDDTPDAVKNDAFKS